MVDLADIKRAQATLKGKIHRTPLVSSETISKMAGTQLWFKAELFQKTGAFKVRGALNRISNLSAEERRRGVVTSSSGNHAQAVAYASRLLGVKAVVVMPATAVANKVAATKGYGAEVILHDDHATLFERAIEVQKQRNLVMVHPFEDDDVIAGQGTMGLEILEDRPETTIVVAAIGGGGSVSGIATAVKTLKPGIKVYGVQAENTPTMVKALEAGRPVPVRGKTIADGLCPPSVGPNTLAIVQRLVDKVVTVSEDEIRTALRLLIERSKLVVEPSGAATVAAVLAKKIHVKPTDVVVCLLSGGNVSVERLAEILVPQPVAATPR